MKRSIACAAAALMLLYAAAAQAQTYNPLGVGAVDSYVKPKGAFINTLAPGGPAASGGIVPGDVITEIDGQAVTSAQELEKYLSTHHTGDTVRLHVVHYGNVP